MGDLLDMDLLWYTYFSLGDCKNMLVILTSHIGNFDDISENILSD
jgi:hypothetical protein